MDSPRYRFEFDRVSPAILPQDPRRPLLPEIIIDLLRKLTGEGLCTCRYAYTSCNGRMDLALEYLKSRRPNAPCH